MEIDVTTDTGEIPPNGSSKIRSAGKVKSVGIGLDGDNRDDGMRYPRIKRSSKEKGRKSNSVWAPLGWEFECVAQKISEDQFCPMLPQELLHLKTALIMRCDLGNVEGKGFGVRSRARDLVDMVRLGR